VPDQSPSAKGEVQGQDEDVLQHPNACYPVQPLESSTDGVQPQIDPPLHEVVMADHVQQEHDQNNVEDVVDGAHVLHLQQSGEVRFPGNEDFFGQLSLSLFLAGFLGLERWPWTCAICMTIWRVADVRGRLAGHAIMPGALPIRPLEVGELVGPQLPLS